MSEEIERGPCEECGEEIAVVANECTHCGHNPAQEQYYGPIVCIMFGSLLTIFIVTAVIGVPLVLIGIVWALAVARGDDPMPIADDVPTA